MNGEIKLQFKHPNDLIRSINPQMPAEQVVAQIRLFNEMEYNETQAPVVDARRQLLEENGYDSDSWVFYSIADRLGGQSDQDLMEVFAKPFPSEIEFLVIQGAFFGGRIGTPGASGSLKRYRHHPNAFTVFVRVRPKQLVETRCEER